MKIERFLVALGLVNVAVLLINLAYLVVAGWLPGQ
jgi:hypothetical protein